MADPRTALITDWRAKEHDLPDIDPSKEHDLLITPQQFVVLHYVLVRERGLVLVRLGIGAVEDLPFELINDGDDAKVYHLKNMGTRKEDLANTGAAVAADNMVAIPPGLDVHLLLRNERLVPVKPRAALFVQEAYP